jgi:hypothetical protein
LKRHLWTPPRKKPAARSKARSSVARRSARD